ncbi:MAG TPA: ATPase, T2SS/T4P/T4SS family [Phycisphaerae bacterium]|jgi:type IV pilus assembly protein PilB|nr:ATPase, T2SS/T4P/T4SS family [Phycisphaerae bacterium]
MARKRKEITDILMEMGVMKPADVQKATAEAGRSYRPLHEVILDLRMAPEEEVTKALAMQYDMEYYDLDKSMLAASNFSLIPPDLIKKHQVLPIEKKDGVLRIVIGDPTDIDTIDALKFRLNTKLETCLGVKSKIKSHIDRVFAEDGSASIDKAVRNAASIDTSGKSIDIKADGKSADPDDAPIIKLVAQIITEAVKSRASDIHIEPMKDRVRIRYRIDGVCVERDNIAKRMQAPVTARVKIMSGMDIAEKRLPQDGRIKMMIDEKQVDFRVSALPGYHGESIVLRILRPDSVKIGIQSMGFEEEDYARFKKIIARPNGIFLVTGPTGSGKTTTLYGALQELNKPDKKIITAEDPVEYNFPGINQCQVREAIGLSFAKILRSMLRQAPNIILVGEIRDIEVAEVAIQAALTGHLVFSTLHTNDAPSAITRLIDMGVKPFLVASSVQAIMAQRLIRTLCDKCKGPDPDPDKKLLALMGFTEKELAGRTLMRAVGCPNCNGTGYRGRKGIFEMMLMNNEVRELAFKRAPANILRKAAKASGMKSLLDDGRIKILAGITTCAEIARVTQAEGIIAEQPG